MLQYIDHPIAKGQGLEAWAKKGWSLTIIYIYTFIHALCYIKISFFKFFYRYANSQQISNSCYVELYKKAMVRYDTKIKFHELIIVFTSLIEMGNLEICIQSVWGDNRARLLMTLAPPMIPSLLI